MSHAYYNENDLKAAAWLRELIADRLIAPGTVDERDIKLVQPSDLNGFSQHHFFAGIGGWSYALRLAGWPDDRPVWTASCPCQPFSAAGAQMGNADSRHLFPAFRRLVARCGGPTIFGEQVASSLGREWLARVRVEMATLGYAVSASDLCAAGAAAPHLRQRLYWVAYGDGQRLPQRQKRDGAEEQPGESAPLRDNALRCGDAARLAHNSGFRREVETLQRADGSKEVAIRETGVAGVRRASSRLGDDDDDAGSQGRGLGRNGGSEWAPWSTSLGVRGSDGKTRRIEPGIFPLAARLPSRVGLIRGAGNAIVPQIAARFIQACEDARTL